MRAVGRAELTDLLCSALRSGIRLPSRSAVLAGPVHRPLSRKRCEVLDAERIRGTNSVVDISSIAGLIVSSVAAVISILAWKAAQRSAGAAERQAVEASRSVLISQVVALHEAQATAQDKVSRVSVHLEDTYENPCPNPLREHMRRGR